MKLCIYLYRYMFVGWVVGCEKPNPKMNSCMEIITNPFDLSRVLLEFHHNLRFLEIRVGKTPLRLDSWFNCKVKEFGLEKTLTNPCFWFMYGL